MPRPVKPRPVKPRKPKTRPAELSLAAIALAISLVSALFALPTVAAEATVPGELRFDCHEQPGLKVVVGADGRIASEAAPAATPSPVRIHIINLQHRTSGPEIPARIDSSDDTLTASTATWQPGNSVNADNGRLRLDLTDGNLYLVTPAFGNQAQFRRFTCAAASADSRQLHYRCEAGFELWIDPVKAKDGKAEDGKSAKIRYTGGHLNLPEVYSDSGTRYARDGNALWVKGDEALFQLSGSEQRRCTIAD